MNPVVVDERLFTVVELLPLAVAVSADAGMPPVLFTNDGPPPTSDDSAVLLLLAATRANDAAVDAFDWAVSRADDKDERPFVDVDVAVDDGDDGLAEAADDDAAMVAEAATAAATAADAVAESGGTLVADVGG